MTRNDKLTYAALIVGVPLAIFVTYLLTKSNKPPPNGNLLLATEPEAFPSITRTSAKLNTPENSKNGGRGEGVTAPLEKVTAGPEISDSAPVAGRPKIPHAESAELRRETVKVRIPANVSVKLISVSRKEGLKGTMKALGNGRYKVSGDKGADFSSNGYYLVCGTIKEKEVMGGELTIEIKLAAGEPTETTRSAIEAILSQSSSVEYFEHPAIILGVFSPFHQEMLMDDEEYQAKGEEIEGITCLSFSSTSKLKGDDLRHIACLTSLKRLFLGGSSITAAQLAGLKELYHLRVLDLSKTQVTDDGLAHLKGLTKLRDLDVTDTKVSVIGLKQLRTSLPETRIAP